MRYASIDGISGVDVVGEYFIWVNDNEIKINT